MPSVSSVLVKHLSKWGVSHVFGIPGKPVTPLVLEMDNVGISFVLSKHEEGAGLAAAGYALARNTLGVALSTAGPGGINMLTAAGQALYTNVPVLFLTGSPPIRDIGKVLGQDSTMFGTDLVKMFESVTKFSARVERGEMLRSYLAHAMEHAFTGVKGPVHLNIPADVLLEQIDDFELTLPDAYPTTIASNLDHVATLLAEAKRPLLFIGGALHALDAYKEIEAFAQKWALPVTTTPGGKGVFLSNHPLHLGPYGLGGNDLSEAYLREGVDLLIVVGSQLSDLEIPGFAPSIYPKHIIHFDHEPRFIGKAVSVATTPVLGNIRSNLRALLSFADITVPPRHMPDTFDMEDSPVSVSGELLRGKQVMEILREELPEDTLVYGDAGSHSFYAIKYFDIKVPGTFYFEEVYATMGRAIGYAVGAKFGAPHRTVACLTGDGCMFMNGTEVSTSVNHDAPVLFLVANNQCIDMVDKGMERHLGRAVGTTYKAPLDGAKFGEALGARGYRCTTAEELRHAIQDAIRSNQTSVIDIIMDPKEIPPTMKRG